MTKKPVEFYETLGWLKTELRWHGFTDWAERLSDATSGATSGEILGQVRVALMELERTEVPI
jgi:hypothetical protein